MIEGHAESCQTGVTPEGPFVPCDDPDDGAHRDVLDELRSSGGQWRIERDAGDEVLGMSDASYFLGRETVASGKVPGMHFLRPDATGSRPAWETTEFGDL